MNIDNLVNKFRVASRELFNNYFLDEFLKNEDWEFYELFTCLEEELFFALVASRVGISSGTYGQPQPEILATPSKVSTYGIPVLLNREISSGYWDHPEGTAPAGSTFVFMGFFDWDQKQCKDNRYLRAIVKEWPGKPELAGKQVLIEANFLSYNKA